MQIAAFNARCPFEIGDKVKDGENRAVHTITDIACIHYLKVGRVEFRYELDNSGKYVEIVLQMPHCTEVSISCGPYPVNSEDMRKIFRKK